MERGDDEAELGEEETVNEDAGYLLVRLIGHFLLLYFEHELKL